MQDKRAERRQRVFKAGKIVFNDQHCLYNCQVRDQSASGARICVEEAWRVPTHFLFVDASSGGGKRPARVVWRGQGEVGVSFSAIA